MNHFERKSIENKVEIIETWEEVIELMEKEIVIQVAGFQVDEVIYAIEERRNKQSYISEFGTEINYIVEYK